MKTVVITGGSRGIGAAAVELFAARGDRVYFLYEKEHSCAQKVAEETGATPICCDVADKKQVEKAFSQLPELDILICNLQNLLTLLKSILLTFSFIACIFGVVSKKSVPSSNL